MAVQNEIKRSRSDQLWPRMRILSIADFKTFSIPQETFSPNSNVVRYSVFVISLQLMS